MTRELHDLRHVPQDHALELGSLDVPLLYNMIGIGRVHITNALFDLLDLGGQRELRYVRVGAQKQHCDLLRPIFTGRVR